MTLILVLQDGGLPIVEKMEDFQKFLEVDKFIHYAGVLQPYRPGVVECINVLEHKYYKPGTYRNELYILRYIAWNETVWMLLSIPFEEKLIMEKVCKQCGLRVADGIPTMIGGGKVSYFPANIDKVFTLENQPGHPAYRNDSKLDEQLRKGEQETIRVILEKIMKTRR